MIPCGVCETCLAGYTNMCEEREIYGKRRGAYAKYAVVPERILAKLPDVLSMEEAALLENLGVAAHGVDCAPHDPGDVGVVIGCGPIGILAAQTLAAWGVRTVITDLSAPRLDKARECSGATVIDVSQQDPVEVVKEMTHGRGAHFVLETAATQKAFDQALDMVRNVGHVCTIGTFPGPISFNPFFRMTRREITLHSTMGRTWETWRRMVQMIEAGQINMKPLISHILPLEEYERGFELVKSGDDPEGAAEAVDVSDHTRHARLEREPAPSLKSSNAWLLACAGMTEPFAPVIPAFAGIHCSQTGTTMTDRLFVYGTLGPAGPTSMC